MYDHMISCMVLRPMGDDSVCRIFPQAKVAPCYVVLYHEWPMATVWEKHLPAKWVQPFNVDFFEGPLLLTRIKLIPIWISHHGNIVRHTARPVRCGMNYFSIPKLQRLHRWSLGMDKEFHPTLHNGSLFTHAGIKLNHVSKRGPRIQKHISVQVVEIILHIYQKTCG